MGMDILPKRTVLYDASGNPVTVGQLTDDDHDIDGEYGLVTASGLY